MKKLLLFLSVLAATLPLDSCQRAVEKAAKKIRVEAVEKIERQGVSDVRVTARIANGTIHRLVLKSATADIYYGTAPAASLVLKDKVVLESSMTQSVTTDWQVKVADLLVLYTLVRKVAADDISQVFVSVTADGRGGPVSITIERERIPLSEILDNFGLNLQDLKNYLR